MGPMHSLKVPAALDVGAQTAGPKRFTCMNVRLPLIDYRAFARPAAGATVKQCGPERQFICLNCNGGNAANLVKIVVISQSCLIPRFGRTSSMIL